MTTAHSTAPIRVYGRPKGRPSPSFAPLFIRNSMGSIPSFPHIPSITVSAANSDCVAPGARYAFDLGLLTTTSNPSILTFLILYGPTTVMQPAPTGEPGYAPASYAR